MSILLLLFWLSAACYFDYRRDKIPNALIGLGMLTGILYRGYLFYVDYLPGDGNVLLGLGWTMMLQLLGAAAIIVIFYPLYKLGMLGAGDVKLFGLLGFFMKGRECTVCLVGGLAIAALIGVVKLLGQGNFRERMQYFCSYMTDVIRHRAFRLYLEDVGQQEKRRASLHMAGTVLLSVLLHLGGVYGVFLKFLGA
ncbi:MAG: prepilin peptidase [Lachnospiraceae bacterium]|nr:prepilin peptidase [Lachnospiraceae bacterium]